MRFTGIRLALAVAALTACRSEMRAADRGLGRFDIVQVAPIRTTIYLARVTLSVPRFVRHGAQYEAAYEANIVPYFFWDEHGTMRIDVSDDTLRRFAQGKGFHFTGHAVNSSGEVRRIAGQIMPTGPADGRIEVRVYVTRRISMNFHTTYHLPSAAPGGSR